MTNALDIETFEKSGNFYPICVCLYLDGIMYDFYYDGEDIIQKCIELILKKSKSSSTYIYIHNINFDGFIFLESLSKNKIKFEYHSDGTNIYSIKIKADLKEIILKCSYKIIKKKLSDIAVTFNIGKKMVFPHKFSSLETLNYIGKIPHPNFFYNYNDYRTITDYIGEIFNFREYILDYCRNDVLITSKFIDKIRIINNKYGVNIDSCYTSASISLKIFSTIYNKKNISLNILWSKQNFIRHSYYGGRCEVYGNPKEGDKIYHFDFSGMYGQCMKQKFPYGRISYLDNPKNFDIPGFYLIKYNSNNHIPVLPHKSKISGKLMFTNGENRGLYWFEEILLFIKMGGLIIDIEYGIVFDKFDKIFDEFIEEFERVKRIDNIMKIYGKAIINSLYGRMGMRDRDSESIILNSGEWLEFTKRNNVIQYRVIGDYILAEVKTDRKKRAKGNIAIASAITSKGRIMLYNAQQSVINNGGRLCYSDTDSIFACYNRDVSKEKHGEVDWSADSKSINNAVFITNKTYGIEYYDKSYNIKVKGFDSKNLKFSDMYDKFYNESEKITVDNTYISKTAMKMIIKNNIKDLNLHNYDKRKFIENKKETRPYIISNHYLYE